MKIRLEFVTNSSSTSFAVAAGSSLLAALFGIGAMSCECTEPGGGGTGKRGGGKAEDATMTDAAIEAALEASQQAAQQAADAMSADAEAKDQLVADILNAETQKLDATEAKIQSEIDQYSRQWQDALKGADPGDPGYQNLNKQYQDYIDYLKGQLDQVKAQKYEIEVTRAQEAAAQESRNTWVKQQQEDLIQVMEQKSFLEAVARGYGKDKNYDISRVQSQLDQLAQREADIRKTLADNNAEINYTPKQRDDIGPDPELARLNAEYRQKREALEAQQKAARSAGDKKAREALEQKMKQLEADMVAQTKKAAFWNVMTKAAEITQVGADIGVDILSQVTGPAGKTIKTCYTGLKGLAGGIGEGMASGDMAKNIVKGGIGGLSDIGKDMIGDKFGKAAQNIYVIGSEAGKSMVESALDGKTDMTSMIKAGLTGASKGSLDASVSMITDHILPGAKEMPKGLDWSDINVKNFVNSVKSSNPLTVQNIGRDAIGNSLQGAGVDQIKNFIKGDNVIFSGANQDLTGQIIDTGTSMGAPKYAPYVSQGLSSVGNGIKNTGNALA